MSTFVKSVLVALMVSVLVGCGSDASSVVSSVMASGEQQIVDSVTAEKGYPEWVLPSAHGLCPTGYTKRLSGNTMLCHNSTPGAAPAAK
jgi:hypothetical protein